MESGLKHIHYLFIAIYLITYLAKCAMLLMGKTETLATFKKKTIAIESIMALGFIVTGVMMLLNNQQATDGAWLKASGWLHLKLTLVILAIPLGIVGFKKNNKVLVGLSALFFIYVLLLGLPQTRDFVAFF
jgi:uncharacterized membrane protein SirB2